jgi:hypothetical protein
LILLFSPRGLRRQNPEGDSSDSSTRQVLSACRSLGVLESVDGDDGRLRLGASLRANGKPGNLLEYLERVLLEPETADSHGQAAVPLALSWFLAQDPTRPLRLENVRDLLERQQGEIPGSYSLTNAQTFQNLFYWAQYLGFGWRTNAGRGDEAIPDPTTAIGRHLAEVIPSNESIPLHVALERLAHSLPVMEGGLARIVVDDRMTEAYRRPGDRLSRSTSFALVRLQHRRSVALENFADARITVLDTLPVARPFTHIRRLESQQ